MCANVSVTSLTTVATGDRASPHAGQHCCVRGSLYRIV